MFFSGLNLMSIATASSTTDRDLRLDFFRGPALFCIFIDHLPTISWRGLRSSLAYSGILCWPPAFLLDDYLSPFAVLNHTFLYLYRRDT